MEPGKKEQAALEFTYDQKKVLSPQEMTSFQNFFTSYDKNGDATMDEKEFKQIMVDMGFRHITDEKLTEMLASYDSDKNGVISWSEFVSMMIGMKKTDMSKFGNLVETAAGKVAKLETDGAIHTYSIEERSTFSNLINVLLKGDPDLADRVPLDPASEDLFHIFDNGIAMNKLLLMIEEDIVDERAIIKKSSMSVFEVNGNINMAIAAAKSLGLKLIGIDSKDIINKTPHMILTFVWQALRAVIAKKITLKDTPEIMRLANEGEELKDLNKLPTEQLLIRWINFHLNKAGQTRRVTNLGKDLTDSFALFHVLNQLDNKNCSLDGIDTEDLNDRAQIMINNSMAMGVPQLVGPRDITAANVKINTLFVAYIFNTKHGLEELTEEEYAAAAMLDDDIEGTKEERAFRLWMNSLGIEGLYVNDLGEECRDGILFCQLVNRLDDKLIDWKKVDQKPKNDFARNINNNQAVDAAKKMKTVKLIAIGGPDITKGQRKEILAFTWQLVRTHYLQLIGGKTEVQLVQWANELVAGKETNIADLKDASLSSGKFLINMLAAIEPRAVNWDLVTAGETDEDKCMNAKYALSIARRLGAVVFCVWEDIAEKVNPKQMLILFATITEIQQSMAEAKKA